MKKRLVIALGGNALGNTPEQQLELVKTTAKTIVDLSEAGYDIIVGHGNGPQVGMINLAMDFSANNGGKTPYMPFPECGAMSQGYIGYHLQQAIQEELKKRGIKKECATVVTQVVVDEHDPAFQKPTKPVGSFYSKEEADKIAAEKGFTFVEDAGRGYRRVVPSPIPQRIVELNVVEQLVQAGDIVITVGGGGIPVIETPEGLKGVASVIDKDRSSAKLALDIKADMLVILTAVDRVCINFNKPDQKELPEMNVADAKKYIAEKQFAPGSMLPKVESCIEFVTRNGRGGTALITSLERASEALEGKTGTVLKQD
jgi:carbamate kinase